MLSRVRVPYSVNSVKNKFRQTIDIVKYCLYNCNMLNEKQSKMKNLRDITFIIAGVIVAAIAIFPAYDYASENYYLVQFGEIVNELGIKSAINSILDI